MRILTVGSLRKILDEYGADDDVIVLVPERDHSYRHADAQLTTALYAGRDAITEDYGESTTPEVVYGKRVKALVIS